MTIHSASVSGCQIYTVDKAKYTTEKLARIRGSWHRFDGQEWIPIPFE